MPIPDPRDKSVESRRKRRSTTEPAFDLWLKRGLHEMFDEVAKEPIPEELLRLIEEDRSK